MAQQNRVKFGSKLGMILATAGGAVGLGNVWRFPYMTGQNGGAAFILIYLACILLLGLPVQARHINEDTYGNGNDKRGCNNSFRHRKESHIL